MTTAIIVAAGSSSRMKTNISKQLIELDGIPVIIRTINVFEFLSEIDSVLIVTRKCDIEIIKKLVSEHNIKKVSAVIEGGSTRQESVFLGLSHLNSGNDDIVLVDKDRYLKSKLPDRFCNLSHCFLIVARVVVIL